MTYCVILVSLLIQSTMAFAAPLDNFPTGFYYPRSSDLARDPEPPSKKPEPAPKKPEPTSDLQVAHEDDPPLVREMLKSFEDEANRRYSAIKKELLRESGGGVLSGKGLSMVAAARIKYQTQLDAERTSLLKRYGALWKTVPEAAAAANPGNSPMAKHLDKFTDLYIAHLKTKLAPTHGMDEAQVFDLLRTFNEQLLLMRVWEKSQHASIVKQEIDFPGLRLRSSEKSKSEVINGIMNDYYKAIEKEWDEELADIQKNATDLDEWEKIYQRRLARLTWLDEERGKLEHLQEEVSHIYVEEQLADLIEEEGAYVQKAALEYWYIKDDPMHAERAVFLRTQIEDRWRKIMLAQENILVGGKIDQGAALVKKLNFQRKVFAAISVCGFGAAQAGRMAWDAASADPLNLHFAPIAVGGAAILVGMWRGTGYAIKTFKAFRAHSTAQIELACAKKGGGFSFTTEELRDRFYKSTRLGGDCDIRSALNELVGATVALPACSAIDEARALVAGIDGTPDSKSRIRITEGTGAPNPLDYIQNPADREAAEKAAFELEAEQVVADELTKGNPCQSEWDAVRTLNK